MTTFIQPVDLGNLLRLHKGNTLTFAQWYSALLKICKGRVLFYKNTAKEAYDAGQTIDETLCSNIETKPYAERVKNVYW
jgi:hypothetical protein